MTFCTFPVLDYRISCGVTYLNLGPLPLLGTRAVGFLFDADLSFLFPWEAYIILGRMGPWSLVIFNSFLIGLDLLIMFIVFFLL